MAFLFAFFFWDPYDLNVVMLNVPFYCSVAQSCLTLCDPMDCCTPGFPPSPWGELCCPIALLITFYSFFFLLCSVLVISTIISSSSHPFFCLRYSTVSSFQCIFNLSYCIVHCLFFNSSRSLLNISCIFSVHASSLFICASSLFSRFWIIFTIITLKSFSGKLFPLYLFGLVGFY